MRLSRPSGSACSPCCTRQSSVSTDHSATARPGPGHRGAAGQIPSGGRNSSCRFRHGAQLGASGCVGSCPAGRRPIARRSGRGATSVIADQVASGRGRRTCPGCPGLPADHEEAAGTCCSRRIRDLRGPDTGAVVEGHATRPPARGRPDRRAGGVGQPPAPGRGSVARPRPLRRAIVAGSSRPDPVRARRPDARDRHRDHGAERQQDPSHRSRIAPPNGRVAGHPGTGRRGCVFCQTAPNGCSGHVLPQVCRVALVVTSRRPTGHHPRSSATVRARGGGRYRSVWVAPTISRRRYLVHVYPLASSARNRGVAAEAPCCTGSRGWRPGWTTRAARRRGPRPRAGVRLADARYDNRGPLPVGTPGSVTKDLLHLVAAAHDAGLQVVLDGVFTTSEGISDRSSTSWRTGRSRVRLLVPAQLADPPPRTARPGSMLRGPHAPGDADTRARPSSIMSPRC